MNTNVRWRTTGNAKITFFPFFSLSIPSVSGIGSRHRWSMAHNHSMYAQDDKILWLLCLSVSHHPLCFFFCPGYFYLRRSSYLESNVKSVIFADSLFEGMDITEGSYGRLKSTLEPEIELKAQTERLEYISERSRGSEESVRILLSGRKNGYCIKAFKFNVTVYRHFLACMGFVYCCAIVANGDYCIVAMRLLF